MTATITSRLTDAQGRPVHLGAKIAEGGEGIIYALPGRPESVVKIYRTRVPLLRAAKLRAMVTLRTDRLEAVAAWPTSVVTEWPGGPVVGLVMPRAAGKEIHLLHGPRTRRQHFPHASWAFLIHTAQNLARAVQVVHEHGHVVGDLNDRNVLVSDQATICFIDCDSFQIAAPNASYNCDVGMATHTPPELQGRSLRDVIRTPNHDAFGLAVLIFQLLFMGRHPFAGQVLGSGERTLEEAIAQCRFAYAPDAMLRQVKPPPNALPLDAVSGAVAALFVRAFSPSAARSAPRPTPAEWIDALGRLRQHLRVCGRNPAHQYLGSLPACPWCAIEGHAPGLRLFSVVVAAPRPVGTHFDLQAVWAGIAAVPAPPPANFPPSPVPSPAEPEVLAQRRHWRKVGGLAAVVWLVLSIPGFGVPAWLGLVLAVLIGVAVSRIGLRRERRRQRERHAIAVRAWAELGDCWFRQANDAPFQRIRAELESKRREYEELDRRRQERVQALVGQRYEQQRRRYLDRYPLARAGIPGLGPTRIAALRSFGIETADEVTYAKVLAVPGFGAVFASRVVAWSQQVLQGFVYDPTEGPDPADVAVIDREIDALRAHLERDLRAGAGRLAEAARAITEARATLTPEITKTSSELAQAEGNVRALRLC